MSVASCLNRARQAMALLLPVLISRTAGYAIRMSGGVGGGGREVTPYPYVCRARPVFLMVRRAYPLYEGSSSPKPSQMEAKGIAVWQPGIQ
jgi:hypothetical protein